jgi:hypothetical protein
MLLAAGHILTKSPVLWRNCHMLFKSDSRDRRRFEPNLAAHHENVCIGLILGLVLGGAATAFAALLVGDDGYLFGWSVVQCDLTPNRPF